MSDETDKICETIVHRLIQKTAEEIADDLLNALVNTGRANIVYRHDGEKFEVLTEDPETKK